MRLPRALTEAMRERRNHRIDLAEADRLIAGDQSGPGYEGLAELLAAARAPATAEELAGEQAAVAGYAEVTAAHRSAAARKGTTEVRTRRTARTAIVNITAAVALLAAGGTAVAARTGQLPDRAQQGAHRLFSALGVPAPGTAPAATPHPTGTNTGRPRKQPSPSPDAPTPTAHPAPSVTAAVVVPPGWCTAWRANPSKDTGLTRKLAAAAGGAEKIAGLCATTATPSGPSGSASPAPSTSRSASASPSAPVTASPSAPAHGKPSSHPTPHATTPSHPGKPQ
jgi:hypothetical protein